jgi:hypothetical protein
MLVEVRFKLRQALSETVFGSSLAGDGLLVRLRSTSIALLAVVAVIGLGLVAFILQLGWPTVFSGPIPEGPGVGVVRNDSIEMPRAPVRAGVDVARARVVAARHRGTRGTPSSVPSEAGLAPSRQTEPAPAESSPPFSPTPSHPVVQPTGTTEPETVVVTAPVGSTGEPTDGDAGTAPSRPPEPQRDAPVKSSKGNGHGRGGGGGRDSRADDHGRGHEVRKPKGDEGAQGSAGYEVEPVDDEPDSAPEDRDHGPKHGGKGWKAH